MRYILPADALNKIVLLRDQFQKEKNINLNEKPSIIGMPTLFGGTDLESRKKQIAFLEKVLIVLRPNLRKPEEITTPERLQATITAWRVYLSACWYIQSQNSSHSTLNKLINRDLGITAENFPDEEDKENCYATATRFINVKGAFEEANAALIREKKSRFKEKEWAEFSDFIAKSNVKKISGNTFTNYPITSITQPLFRTTLSYTGATVGLLAGDIISKSTEAMTAKYQLVALIGGTLLVLGPAGSVGAALLAPVIASKVITTFCSITLAHVLGTTMGMLGYGVGTVVGFPLDLAYQLLWKVCTLMGDYCHKEPKQPMITGMRISDGVTIIGDIIVSIISDEELSKHDKKNIIKLNLENADEYTTFFRLKEDGSLYVDGKPIVTPENGVQLPDESIKKLREYLKVYTNEPCDYVALDPDCAPKPFT
jgi:hypothetical protein